MNPNASAALKAKWQDPVFRAKMAIRESGHRYPGQADGMTKEETFAVQALVREKVDYIMDTLEMEGILKFTTDEDMARECLREAFRIALSPGNAQTQMAAIRTVLEFTKAKPATKTDLTLKNHEAWLNAVVADHNKEENERDGSTASNPTTLPH